MARGCLSDKLIGKKLHNQCKCKERAASYFKSIDKQLEQQAKTACNTNEPESLQTAADFARALNISETEFLGRYGLDVDKTNGEQTATASNQKLVYLVALLVFALLIYFIATLKK